MRIVKIKGITFGKLKQKTFEFTPGLNVVYGKNESGKSTTQALMKAMLYGINGSKRSIAENPRLKYTPWSGEQMEGELNFLDDEGKEYRLHRTFGTTKSKDTVKLYHASTGKEEARFKGSEIGNQLLGFGEEAFERTMMISQLGVAVHQDKQDEIMKKLSNLAQSGDEEISYQKSVDALNEAQRKLDGNRKEAKLKVLQEQLEQLEEEKRKALEIHHRVLDFQGEIVTLDARLEMLQRQIALVELDKKEVLLREAHKEYLVLKDYQDKIGKAQEEVDAIEKQLTLPMGVLEDNLLSSLKQEHQKLVNLNLNIEQLEEEIQKNQERLQGIEVFEHVSVGEQGEQGDVLDTLHRCDQEIQQYREYEAQVLEVEKRRTETTAVYEGEKQSLGELAVFASLTEDMLEEIQNKESTVGALKERLNTKGNEELYEFKLESLQEKKKQGTLLAGIGIVATLVVIALGVLLSPVIFVGVILSLALLLYGVNNQKAAQKKITALEHSVVKSDEGPLSQELQRVELELQRFYGSYGCKDLLEFQSKWSRFQSCKGKLVAVELRRKDVESQLELLHNKMKTIPYESTQNVRARILEEYDCTTIEEVRAKYKEQEGKRGQKNSLQIVIQELDEKLHKYKNSKDELEAKLLERIGDKVLPNNDLGGFTALIEWCEKQLEIKRDLCSKIAQFHSGFQALLKGRNYETIVEAMKEVVLSPLEQELPTVQLLEESLVDASDAWNDVDKKKTSLEIQIQNELSKCREVGIVESEIKEVKAEIQHYQEVKKGLELAKGLF